MPAGLILCAGPHCIWQRRGASCSRAESPWTGYRRSGYQEKPAGLFHVSVALCVCACTLAQASFNPWTETGPRPLPLPHTSPLRGLLVSSVEWKNPTPAHDSLGSPAQAVGLERNSHVFHCAKAGTHSDGAEGPGHPPLPEPTK